jgi:hypothetical protein
MARHVTNELKHFFKHQNTLIMQKTTTPKKLDRQAMRKIKGGGYSLIPACTWSGERKCSRSIPCPAGCICAGNRCAPEEIDV